MNSVFHVMPMQKFENWFARPLRILALLKDGDAAFIAFGTALALYERLIRARLKNKGLPGSPDNFRTEAASDLRIDKNDFAIWWEIFRDGINHQASPKKVRKGEVDYGWLFAHTFEAVPKKDGNIFKVDPWKFVELIVHKYSTDQNALTTTDTYSLGDIECEIVEQA